MDHENTSKPLTQRQLKAGENLKKIIANIFIKDQFKIASHFILILKNKSRD